MPGGTLVTVVGDMIGRLAMTAPLCLLFVSSGLLHFLNQGVFLGLMRGLPFPSLHVLAVQVSGVLEVALGLGLLFHPSPIVCNAGIALVLAITPANINMWWRGLDFQGEVKSARWHLFRAVMQVVLLVWLYLLSLHGHRAAGFYQKHD